MWLRGMSRAGSRLFRKFLAFDRGEESSTFRISPGNECWSGFYSGSVAILRFPSFKAVMVLILPTMSSPELLMPLRGFGRACLRRHRGSGKPSGLVIPAFIELVFSMGVLILE